MHYISTYAKQSIFSSQANTNQLFSHKYYISLHKMTIQKTTKTELYIHIYTVKHVYN